MSQKKKGNKGSTLIAKGYHTSFLTSVLTHKVWFSLTSQHVAS